MRYHQYADDTQLCISILGEVSDAVTTLSRCLEAVGAWMGNNRIRLNPGKMEWLWVNGCSISRPWSSLVLDGVALPQTDLGRNMGVLLDSQLLLKEQVAVMARGPLHSFVLCASYALSWIGSPSERSLMPWSSVQTTAMCSTWGYP